MNDEQDRVQFWRPSFIARAELVSVACRCRNFSEHSHAEYVIGTVTEGAERCCQSNADPFPHDAVWVLG